MKNFVKEYNFPKNRLITLKDIKQYEDLLGELMLTQNSKEEIAEMLLTTTALLDEYARVNFGANDFSSLLETYKARSKAMLLNKQYELALGGSEKMLIFLGKNYAKQVDDGTKALLTLESDRVVIQNTAVATESDIIGDYKDD